MLVYKYLYLPDVAFVSCHVGQLYAETISYYKYVSFKRKSDTTVLEYPVYLLLYWAVMHVYVGVDIMGKCPQMHACTWMILWAGVADYELIMQECRVRLWVLLSLCSNMLDGGGFCCSRTPAPLTSMGSIDTHRGTLCSWSLQSSHCLPHLLLGQF